MDEQHLLEKTGIDPADWEKTPESVKRVVVQFSSRIEQLEQHIQELQVSNQLLAEKVNCSSKNSSLAPSSDPPSGAKRKPKSQKRNKRGGQPGHPGHSRSLYSVEECDR